MSSRLTVNGKEFLVEEAAVPEISERVLRASRGGGGYVHVTTVTGHDVDVLVTPSTLVMWDVVTPITPARLQNSETDWDGLIDWPPSAE